MNNDRPSERRAAMKLSSYIKKMPDNKGQSLVEFALILILILIVLFGITEFGRAWLYNNTLTNGVRTGVRYATSLENSTSFEANVRSVTLSNITSSIPNNNIVITVTRTPSGGGAPNTDFESLASGDLITVRATTDFSFLTGIMDIVFKEENAGPNTLSRQASMRYE